MKSPFELIANAINRHTFIVAGLVLGIMLFALYGASMTSMKTGPETYLYKDEPVGSLLLHYTDLFGSDSVILIIEGDDVTSPAVLKYLDQLEIDLSNERYIAGIKGLPDLVKSVNGGVLPQSQAEIDACINALPAEYSEKVLPSNTMTLMSVPLEAGYPEEAERSIVETVNAVIELSEPPAGITVSASGSPAFSVEMQDDMQKNMGNLIGLAMVLMIVAMALLFGHVRYRMLPVLIVFCGIILTFGVMGITGIPISSIVIAAFPVLIGIGIDYAIQFHSRFDEEIRHSSIQDAVKTTITSSGPAILLAMIATSLGFAALSLLAPSPMVADFGTICIVGIACCYLSAMIIVPTFGKLINYRPKECDHPSHNTGSTISDLKGYDQPPAIQESPKESLMEKYDIALGKLAVKIAKHPIPIILILLMLAIVGMQLDSKVIIDTDEDAMVDQNMPALITMKKVTSVMGSTSTITAYVKADSVKNYDTLRWMDEFGEYAVSKHNELTGATNIASIIKSYNGGVLPKNQYALERVWNSIPESTRENYVNGNTEAVIEFSMDDISIPATQELISHMEDDLNWYTMHPGMDVKYTGQMYMFSDLINGIKETKNLMTYLGFIMIFVFLLLVYRKFTAVSPLVPIVMIVGWNGLIMYSLGLTYSLLTATLGAMTIGVASEYTILIMERFEEETAKGEDTFTAIQTSIQKIGTAISVSGLTTVFGFSALILSTSPIIQNFGTVTVVTVGFSLIGAIVVMPAVISLMKRFKVQQT